MLEHSVDEAQLIEFGKTVNLVASRVLEGMHKSRRGGDGLEFHSAVPYAQGEDVRRVDWKRFAATDRFYVRKFEREEKTSWHVFLDQSNSMEYGSKKQSAFECCASLGLLSQVWSDQFDAYPADVLVYEEVLSQMLAGRLGLDFSKWPDLEPNLQARVILISDFFTDLGPLFRWIENHRDRAHSFHFIQIVDQKEKNFQFNDVFRFEDMESSNHLTLDANVIRELYKKEFQQQQEQIQSFLQDEDSFTEFVSGETDLSEALLHLFSAMEEEA